MSSNHHPLPETLVSYASGTLSNALSCVVACHLSMCSDCADDVRQLELVGGLMLEGLETIPADTILAERAATHWAAQHWPGGPEPDPLPKISDPLLPVPLVRYLGTEGAQLRWKMVVKGVQQCWITLPEGSGEMRLLRLVPGQLLFKHANSGDMGLALVLQGVCRDHAGDYLRGDVIEWEEDSPRQPRASGDVECICLIASDEIPVTFARPDQAPRRLRRRRYLPELRVREIWDRKLALTTSIAVIAGIGLGWLFWGEAEDNPFEQDELVQTENNHLVARGILQNGLDILPSGKQMFAFSKGSEFRLAVKMTFQSQAGDYCRQYYCRENKIADASSELYSGIACRTGDQWAVKIQALIPPFRTAAEQVIPAGEGEDPAMDAVLASLISGDPLVGQDEAAVMNNGWKK